MQSDSLDLEVIKTWFVSAPFQRTTQMLVQGIKAKTINEEEFGVG